MKRSKPNLDKATIQVLRKMLATPPKSQEDMKLVKPSTKKKRTTNSGSTHE